MRPRIYAASSWRNQLQPEVVTRLRTEGYEVYDFRHPAPGNEGFSWRQTDPAYDASEPANHRRWHMMTSHAIARSGFKLNYDAMKAADAFVLVLPSGRSAHLEAGYAAGAGKRLIVLMPEPQEPELMYLMANAIVATVDEVVGCLAGYYAHDR